MKRIRLTQGKFVLVDNSDFEWLSQWKWSLDKDGYVIRSFYARNDNNEPITKHWSMHRLINNTPDGLDTDHINRNKLDNRRSNLRSVTNQQNQFNLPLSKINKSGYKGVFWVEDRKKWQARIGFNNKSYNLGRYSSLEDALKIREEAERNYWI